LKIIFERTPQFRQWAVLFGDEQPERSPMAIPSFWKKRQKEGEVIRERGEGYIGIRNRWEEVIG